jgi:valyl-tRNA synthetase
MIGILNLDVTVNDLAPEKYRGLDRFVARKAIVADLDVLGASTTTPLSLFGL